MDDCLHLVQSSFILRKSSYIGPDHAHAHRVASGVSLMLLGEGKKFTLRLNLQSGACTSASMYFDAR